MKRNNRGFFQFLLANPMLMLSAALGVALVVAGLAAWSFKALYESEYAKRLEAETVVTQMVDANQKVADANAKILAGIKHDLSSAEARHSAERAGMVAQLDRMRRAPTRPDSTAIPITACTPGGANGVPQEWILASEYASLQERAAYDALQVTQLQDYINATRPQ